MSNHTSAASEPLTKPDDTQRRGATPVPGCEDASADEAKASVRLCGESDPDSFTEESHDDVSDSEDGYYQTAPTSPIEGTPPVGTIPPPTQDVPLQGTVHPVVLVASASQSTVTEATIQSTADLKAKAKGKQKARLQALSKPIPKEQLVGRAKPPPVFSNPWRTAEEREVEHEPLTGLTRGFGDIHLGKPQPQP